MSFDPFRINEYTIEELIHFMENDGYSMGDFQNAGLSWDKQAQIRDYLQQEESYWEQAMQIGTEEAYQLYLSKYPTGKHVLEAELAIIEIRKLKEKLEKDLKEEMLREPHLYSANVMNRLLGMQTQEHEDDPQKANWAWQRFLSHHLHIDYEWLLDKGILPLGRPELKKAITQPDFSLPQLTIDELGDFPTDRTDVYFLGMPGSGKSCVLSGIINAMNRKGVVCYVPQFNESGMDNCNVYYNGLIRSVNEHKVPMSTGSETISFMKLDVGGVSEKKNQITMVELSGEAFNRISERNMTGENVWKELGAGQCLKNNNDKLLFFLVDYLTISGNNPRFSPIDQELKLKDALTVLTSDGPGKDPSVGCTLSKVKTVAVIVTKSDLMPDASTSSERKDVAMGILQQNYRNFMNNLAGYCERFGINKANWYMPYVLTFSLGDFYVGNTVDYNPADSSTLVEFIRDSTSKSGKSLGNILGIRR